jgi:hypothetical protein
MQKHCILAFSTDEDSGGSRIFEMGTHSKKEGDPPPKIAKHSLVLGLKSWVLLIFDGRFRVKRGEGGACPPSKSATRRVNYVCDSNLNSYKMQQNYICIHLKLNNNNLESISLNYQIIEFKSFFWFWPTYRVKNYLQIRLLDSSVNQSPNSSNDDKKNQIYSNKKS